MKNNLQSIILGFLAIALLSSCFSINNFQTAKTLKKNQAEVGIGVAGGTSVEFDAEEQDTFTGFDGLSLPYGDLILFTRYGITDRLDLGFRASVFGDAGLDLKYMLIGDHESFFTLSPGLGLSTNFWLAGLTGIFQIEVPIHTSIQLTDNFNVFLTPRYVGQTNTAAAFDDGVFLNYVGGSAGLEFGNDVKFILGINYMKTLEYDISNFNVGAGVRYRFGGEDTNSR